MTIQDYRDALNPLVEQAKESNDALCLVYFSRADDRFGGTTIGMDPGDALIVVKELIKQFALDAEAIAAMGEAAGFETA